MNSFAISRTGHGKQKNEDCFVHCESMDKRVSFFAIADGMGGYVYGEIASRITIDVLFEKTKNYEYSNLDELETFLKNAAKEADKKIKEEVLLDEAKKGMGSTVVVAALVIEEKKIVLVNVGDSKGYLYNENGISFVTHDHSVSQLMIDKGYTEEETKKYLRENPVTMALGYMEENEDGESYCADVNEGDILLLCSDGFYKGLEQTEVGWLIKENYEKPIEKICESMIYDALGRESTDDITVIAVKL